MTVWGGRSGFARRHLATALLAVVLLADVGSIVLIGVLIAANAPAPSPILLVLTASYGLVGWIVASRRPDNRIGWVFLVIGLSLSIEGFSRAYSALGSVVSPGSLPLVDAMSWIGGWVWAPGYTFLVTLSVLLFPDGRAPTPRWRPVVWSSFAVMALLFVPVAIASWPYPGLGAIDIGISPNELADTLQVIGLVASIFVAIASIAGMVVRFRRAGRIERQQLKWFGFASVAVITLVITLQFVAPPDFIALVASVLVAPLIPAAAAVAILRYRLYDLDRLVRRTIAYGIVTGALVVIFAIAVLVFQTALEPLTGRNGVAVAASTLLVVALFQPLRRRIQSRVDRRFNRGRYDAEQIVAAFVDRLREDVDLDSLSAHISATVIQTVQPANVSVWLAGKARDTQSGAVKPRMGGR